MTTQRKNAPHAIAANPVAIAPRIETPVAIEQPVAAPTNATPVVIAIVRNESIADDQINVKPAETTEVTTTEETTIVEEIIAAPTGPTESVRTSAKTAAATIVAMEITGVETIAVAITAAADATMIRTISPSESILAVAVGDPADTSSDAPPATDPIATVAAAGTSASPGSLPIRTYGATATATTATSSISPIADGRSTTVTTSALTVSTAS